MRWICHPGEGRGPVEKRRLRVIGSGLRRDDGVLIRALGRLRPGDRGMAEARAMAARSSGPSRRRCGRRLRPSGRGREFIPGSTRKAAGGAFARPVPRDGWTWRRKSGSAPSARPSPPRLLPRHGAAMDLDAERLGETAR
jgi:hypothetical protein